MTWYAIQTIRNPTHRILKQQILHSGLIWMSNWFAFFVWTTSISTFFSVFKCKISKLRSNCCWNSEFVFSLVEFSEFQNQNTVTYINWFALSIPFLIRHRVQSIIWKCFSFLRRRESFLVRPSRIQRAKLTKKIILKFRRNNVWNGIASVANASEWRAEIIYFQLFCQDKSTPTWN